MCSDHMGLLSSHSHYLPVVFNKTGAKTTNSELFHNAPDFLCV